MDDSWPVKCGSTLPSMASSPTQEAGNQTEVNAGRYFHPHVGQDLRLQAQGRMPDPMFANISSLGSYSSGHADLGNSFVALLSGPASLLQCDFQELSNPKQFSTSTKIPIVGSNVAGNITGSWGQLKSNGIPPENVSYRIQRNGADLSPVISSRAACSSNSVLQHDLQSANICLQSSDLAKAVIHHIFPGIEKVNDFSSSRGEWHSSTPANAVKLPSTSNLMLQTKPLQSKSSVSRNSSTLTGGCPRVFCSRTTGDLLLSNTGLLGILCSCHCFHMSVSKFCEHSGLQNVNPGDAVRLESGETIGQWRKLYFQKLGIRVPEDQSGWDWPEGLSLTSSLVKSSVSTALPKNSDCNHPDSCSGGLLRSGQSINNNVFPKNPLADQNSNQNSVIDAFHNEQQRNGRGGKKLPGLGGTLRSNSPVVVDDTPHAVTDIAISRCTESAKFVGKGPESDCQSIATHIDDIMKSGNSSTAHPTLQNLRALFKSNDVSRAKYGKDGAIIDRDVASSSIELRLGQPSQQIQPLGNPVIAALRPQICNIPVDSQMPSREQMIHYGTSCRGEEESRQSLPLIADVANSTQRREQHQLDYGHHAINNAMDFAQLEKCQSNVDKASMFSPFKHFNPPPVGVLPFRATNNAVDISEHTMCKTLPGESHAIKCNAVNVSWNGGNGLERQWKDPEFGFFRPADKGKGAGCLTHNSFVETSLGSKMHKWMTNQSSATRVAGGNSYSGLSATHENNHSSCHLTRTPPDVSDAGILPNYPRKIPCFGSHVDHVFPGAIGSSLGSRQILPSQAVSIGPPSSPSTSISGLTPALSKQETIGAGPYLLEDNLRLLALRQIMELSKQQHEMSSLGKNPEQERCNDSSNVKLQHCRFEPSAFGFQRQAANFTSKPDVSEFAMNSIHSTPVIKIGDGVDKFAHLTGLNNWCNFSTMTQGMPLCSKEMDKQCQLSHDQLETEQPSLRLGRSGNTTIHSNEHESCCQIRRYFQNYCSCVAPKNCLGSKCNCTSGNPPDAREQMGFANDKIPTLIASKIVKDQTFPHEATSSLDNCSKFRGQAPKNLSGYVSQWKDVPSKTKEVHKVVCIDQSAGILGGRQSELDHLADTAAKCFGGAVHMTDSFKEQEISNISSGCSAPAVTQASVEVNNLDSTVVAESNRCLNHLIVDEGSGIDRSWSSDDAPESDRSADFYGSTSKTRLRKDGSFEVIDHKPSRSLLDDVKLMDSLTWKRGQNQIHAGINVHQKINHSLESEGGLKIGKRKREMKLKLLDASQDPAVHSAEDKYHKWDDTAEWPCLSKDVQMVSSGWQKPRISGVSSIKPISKHGKPSLSMSKPPSHKRDVHRLYNERYGEDGARTASNNNVTSDKNIEVSGRKKFRRSVTCDNPMLFQEHEPIHAVGEKSANSGSGSHVNVSLSLQVNGWNRNARPVVCGKFGEISNGKIAGKQSKPAKIVSLDTILKTTKKCTLPKVCDPKLTSVKDLKRTRSSWINACSYKFSNMKKENAFVETSKHSADECLMLEKETEDKRGASGSILDSNTCAHSRPKLKEIRRRSLSELTSKGKNLGSAIISQKEACALKMKTVKIPSSSEDSYCHMRGSIKVNAKRCIQEQKHLSAMGSESFCCVCGSSNKDEVNCLLECGQCSIKVHQACYGVPKVPKGHWYCRPCRIGSKNIICVICGYGGGAMTRALRTRTLAKSLLKAWSFETECGPNISISSSENLQNELSILHSSESVPENSPYPVLRHGNDEPSTSSVSNIAMPNQLDILPNSLHCVSNLKVHNSVTAGILDSTVKQWVHMVCGLWTPGTRCPNVDTMSAFDVSGASHPQTNMVCSICNRGGGSCIECRVVNCSVHFHPWCAHQKGLLQSEVEGADNENVGFYGRCVLHATYPTDEYACDAASGEKEESCARTEGYKGRKRDGFWHNLHGQYKSKGGCLVPQEQLNAWVHINAQKTSTQVLSKLPMSDVEHDCRKEYARYKQVKGWKYLVVYKSGIHALGLYTSRFIYRSEMVVEYVGEIVGQRVADKREIEYQSGRKLQYKSACYFFRIDKEHIIDATRKGGIARFVNHSCLPNCVAKVISVRNEKKVVFFAERDIYPGEEITYDYHFNHEDEGKKIPCFCNSKNCRRYLN